jgi:hypothetical protein
LGHFNKEALFIIFVDPTKLGTPRSSDLSGIDELLNRVNLRIWDKVEGEREGYILPVLGSLTLSSDPPNSIGDMVPDLALNKYNLIRK